MSNQLNTYFNTPTSQESGARTRRRSLSEMASAVLAVWQRRRTIAALDRLDDWTLYDIGLVRSDIPKAVDGLVASRPRPAYAISETEMSREPEALRKAA